MKDLFELIRQVGEQLTELDPNGQLWHAIRIKQDSSLGKTSVKSAQVVMLRYAMVELVRCWKELELHPAFKREERISDTALREVGHMWDCDEFSLEKIAKAKQKPKPACYFKYAGELDEVMDDIFPLMQREGLIAKETKKHQLKLMFNGKESSVVIQWTGELHTLTHLFKELSDGENPPLITLPE